MWYLGSWLFPIVSACMWLAMLLAMFIHWEVIGHPHYPSMEKGQRIAYISDVGAFGLKPLFITGCVITTVSLDLGFMAERWLRHTGRLVPNTSTAQKVLSSIAIVFAVAGSAGLILLSIFDTYHHPKLHDGFLLLFIGGYVLSAVFLCAEYQRLGIHYRHHRILRISFYVKLFFILIEVAMAIVFASTTFTKHQNIAAIFEWLVALIFTFYVLSFLLDLLPSVRTKNHIPQGWREAQLEKAAAGLNGAHDGPGAPITSDSAGPNQNSSVDDDASRGYRGTAMTNGAGSNVDLSLVRTESRWKFGGFRL
ncbi:hypothetical protein HRR83_003134 [Exophiala dermatitidis]|uniref:CWH43-like N-terminal domain-containing protein n=1 Tax=Exophiala dermatitidis TaxID=5970 RepID=A0AAN6ELQ1_EXODE|nr:hypothetical protein HRR75_007549 [Exophiala dermatitidis]KAJ4506324.1 hypothetical protein HRR73_008122 [Exophiala dermatitidis]KAJ4506905.1 hypothetical protein HRR74_008221 [Exophiala dermatitidis]KAJ4547906.1 hypothetical protein HRR76_000527 [Exophiala dermatitidis]KAJ4553847.1 hypothetical protein HRR77_002217 [Exophiala dermatitidis]